MCLKTKITRASCRRRAGTVVPRAEHLVTWLLQITKFSVKKVNPVTIIDTLLRYKIWQRSGYHITHVNKNFPGDPEEPNEVPRADEETKSQLHWQFLGIWQVLRGIILESLNVNATQIRNKWDCREKERAVRRVKEGTSAVLLQSGLDKEWWADSMECYCLLRNMHDLLSDGKTPYEWLFWMPCNGPVIPFGAMVEYHPTSAKDTSILHQFGPKVLPGMFLGYVLYAGRNVERRHYTSKYRKMATETLRQNNGYGESYDNKCATNYNIITNNNWNDTHNKQLTMHNKYTNDDVDFDDCVVHIMRWVCT